MLFKQQNNKLVTLIRSHGAYLLKLSGKKDFAEIKRRQKRLVMNQNDIEKFIET
jgi:hypothetical protein